MTIIANPFAGITDGTVYWNSATDEGGGFYISGYATASLAGLRVGGNTASEGGGVNITSGYPGDRQTTLLLNQFFGNTATGSASRGGGINAHNARDLLIIGNLISSNSATGSGDGGGANFSECTGLVTTNWFLDNTAAGGDGGGASVYATSNGLTLHGNWFEGNSAGVNGGGLSVSGGGSILSGDELILGAGGPTVDSNT